MSQESYPPPISLDPERTREVFARFGLAMYHAQCIEREVAILLATSFNESFDQSAPDARDEAFETSFRKTMGALVKELRRRGELTRELETRLMWAVKARNWLAHHYFWERSGKILTSGGRDQMISELSTLASDLNALDEELTAMSHRWGLERGITSETLRAHVIELAKEEG